jgi:hypothetical protein
LDLQTKQLSRPALNRIASIFLKKEYGTPRLKIYEYKGECHRYMITIEASGMAGSAKGDGLYLTFIKALVELGERISLLINDIRTSNGVAGGLMKSEAIERAKAESLERDAFLYHYANAIPFLDRNKDDSGVWLYKMAAADSKVHTYIATDSIENFAATGCLRIGMGASVDMKEAKMKAVVEFANSRRLHNNHPDWCEEQYEKSDSIMNFHHTRSRESNIKKHFKCLLEVNSHIRPQSKIDWNITELKSPLRGVSFVRLFSNQLRDLTFGTKMEIKGWNEDLYHPIW